MSIEDAKLLAKLPKGQITRTLGAYLLIATIGLIAGALGAYLAASAQNLATKQDLAQVTRIAEQVRSDIANASWQSQRVWEEKKQLYVQVIRLLDESNLNLMECEIRGAKLLLTSNESPPALVRGLTRQMEIAKELSLAVAVSGIFLSSEAQAAVETFRRSIGTVAVNRDTGAITVQNFPAVTFSDYCREMRQRALTARDAVVAAARTDLSSGMGLSTPTN